MPHPRTFDTLDLGAGGMIKQNIYLDSKPLTYYNIKNPIKIKLEMVNAVGWSQIKVKTYSTQVSFASYLRAGYPWFDLYDADKKALTGNTNSLFNKVDSTSNFNKELVDDEECCICFNNIANMKYNPCNHCICTDCLTKLKKKGNIHCHLCRGKVDTNDITVYSGTFSLDDDSKFSIEECNVVKIYVN